MGCKKDITGKEKQDFVSNIIDSKFVGPFEVDDCSK